MTEHHTGDAVGTPAVSVIMASYNCARFVGDAVRSVLDQTLRDIELIIVDDASTDDTVAALHALAAEDARVRVIALRGNVGPAAARNHALDAARGRWVAVVDSDDLLHPARFERLIAAAEREDAEIVADNQLLFDDDGAHPPRLLLGLAAPRLVSLADFIRSTRLNRSGTNFGFIKPVISADLLRRSCVRYNPAMRNAEDSDLLMRLMAEGGRLLVVPQPWYFYRKHGTSISHRLSLAKIAAMQEALRLFELRHGAALTDPDRAALAQLTRSYDVAASWEALLTALKRRDVRGAVAAVRQHPSVLALLRQPVAARIDRLSRRLRPAARPERDGRRQVCLLTRQWPGGPDAGPEADHRLGLVRALRAAGCDVHLVAPTPRVFSRRPWLRLSPVLEAFTSVRVRRGVQSDGFLFSTEPAVWLQAAGAFLGRRLAGFGIQPPAGLRPLPAADAMPWRSADLLFVAEQAAGRADIVLCDTASLAECIPYVLHPAARAAILERDLPPAVLVPKPGMAARPPVDPVAAALAEARLFHAGAVIGIGRGGEAALPATAGDPTIIRVPPGLETVPGAQPGRDGTQLFAGDNTLPNVQGLDWLLRQVWPRIRAADGAAALIVTGRVCEQVGDVPDGVRLAGRLPDLSASCAEAGVVLCPLLIGGDGRTRVPEAMATGKAIVATALAMQGMEDLVGTAVLAEDDPDRFAEAVLLLLRDYGRRSALGSAALRAARNRYSEARSNAEAVAFLVEGRLPAPGIPVAPRSFDAADRAAPVPRPAAAEPAAS